MTLAFNSMKYLQLITAFLSFSADIQGQRPIGESKLQFYDTSGSREIPIKTSPRRSFSYVDAAYFHFIDKIQNNELVDTPVHKNMYNTDSKSKKNGFEEMDTYWQQDSSRLRRNTRQTAPRHNRRSTAQPELPPPPWQVNQGLFE